MADDERLTATTPSAEMLIASVLHLMSHYVVDIDQSGTGSNLSVAIERHFQVLSNMTALPPVLRGTCSQLSQQWGAQVANATARAPATPSLLARFKAWASGSLR